MLNPHRETLINDSGLITFQTVSSLSYLCSIDLSDVPTVCVTQMLILQQQIRDYVSFTALGLFRINKETFLPVSMFLPQYQPYIITPGSGNDSFYTATMYFGQSHDRPAKTFFNFFSHLLVIAHITYLQWHFQGFFFTVYDHQGPITITIKKLPHKVNESRPNEPWPLVLEKNLKNVIACVFHE